LSRHRQRNNRKKVRQCKHSQRKSLRKKITSNLTSDKVIDIILNHDTFHNWFNTCHLYSYRTNSNRQQWHKYHVNYDRDTKYQILNYNG
jgi:hypothetical protein